MDNVIAELIRSWGTFGLIIVFFGFMIWDKVKFQLGGARGACTLQRRTKKEGVLLRFAKAPLLRNV